MANGPKRRFPGARRNLKHLSAGLETERDRRIAAERFAAGTRFDWVQQLGTAVTALTALGALIFTGLALRESRTQVNVSEQGQITGRYTAAVSQLGSKNPDVRLGGIYALERIMRNSPPDQPTIVEVLSAFVRNHPPGLSVPSQTTAPARPPADTNAALTVLGRRDTAFDKKSIEDLRDVDFRNLDMQVAGVNSIHKPGVPPAGTILSSADLSGADLAGTYLAYADLTGATLAYAHLAGTHLAYADLTNANLGGADLTKKADLSFTNLTGATLTLVDATGADLTGANLTGANLDYANLTNVKLTDANLTNVSLNGTKLDGWDLSGANLWKTQLCDGAKPPPQANYVCTPPR